MDRGAVLLQELRSKLNAGWLGTIARSTGATEAKFLMRENGEFAIEVTWKLKDGTEQKHTKEFTRAGCLSMNTIRPHVQKRACDYAREMMQEIYNLRGVTR